MEATVEETVVTSEDNSEDNLWDRAMSVLEDNEAPAEEVQEETTEEPQNETPEEPVQEEKAPADDQLNNAYAAIARKERALQQERQQIKQQAQQFETMQRELQELKQAKAEAAKDPLKYLEQGGLTYEELTDYILNDNKRSPESEVAELRKSVEQLRIEKEKERQQQQEYAAQQAQQQQINEWAQDCQRFIDESDYYYLKNESTALNDVYDVVVEQYKRDQQLYGSEAMPMTNKQAADLVEKYYAEKAEAAHKLYLARQGDTPKEEPKNEIKKSIGAERTQNKTLSNKQTAFPPNKEIIDDDSEEARFKRAMSLLQFNE